MANILIVDDEPRIVLLLQSLLKANGFTVQTAGTIGWGLGNGKRMDLGPIKEDWSGV